MDDNKSTDQAGASGGDELSALTVSRPKYLGAAWRSRFLRAPKIALELAGRTDFVQLGTLASVKLGLKTGADDFFFLTRQPPDVDLPSLLPSKGIVAVKGKDGWSGTLSKKDLRAALLNPHQLFEGDHRVFSVPKHNKQFYLYPRDGRPKDGLSEYVRVGELAGIESQSLVAGNAKDGVWYRQARALVTSRWALPYNSAYDYGAWRNADGAVLNGRFVGVDAYDVELIDLVGAVLNSTFALIGRLLEGVATGVEGAFDVGPPAARRIRVPDIRSFNPTARGEVLSVLEEIKACDVMPAAPARDGVVVDLRRKLDTAILRGLGLSKGQSAALLETIYKKYAYWRSNVEDVEGQMRLNRRAIQQSGQSRSIRPVDAAGKRVWEEISHAIKSFPTDFISQKEVLEVINLPVGAVIPKDEPLFDAGLIQGKNKSVDLGTFSRVKYASMLKEIGFSGLIEVPTSSEKTASIVDRFEKQKVDLEKLAKQHAASYVSGKEAIDEVADVARKHWLNSCKIDAMKRAAGKKEQGKRRA